MKYNKETIFITFNDAINDNTVKNLMGMTTDLINNCHPSQLYFLFSSSGGMVNSGITLYNFLKSIPIDVVFHNIGSVDSIANCIFLAGKKRYACQNSHFLFHGVTWNFGQGTSFFRKQLQEIISSLQQMESDISNIITSNTSITREEVVSLFDQGESKGLDFALEKGVIHEICEILIPEGNKHFACNFR